MNSTITPEETPIASRAVAGVFLVVMMLLPIPLVMRQFYKSEPYPAVLFPAGASIVKDNGVVRYNSYTAIAVGRDGLEFRLDWRLLLPKYPKYRRAYFAEQGFGITKAPNPQEKIKAQRELKALIIQQTGQTDITELRFRKVLAQLPTNRQPGKKLEETTLKEWVYPLPEKPENSL